MAGHRCQACARALLSPTSRCPACGGALVDELYGPAGTVWAATTVRVATPGRDHPYSLAYVDLDDGPRILLQIEPTGAAAVGDRARLRASTDLGDPCAELVG